MRMIINKLNSTNMRIESIILAAGSSLIYKTGYIFVNSAVY